MIRFLSSRGEVKGVTSLDADSRGHQIVTITLGGPPGSGGEETIEAVEVDGKRFAISPFVLWPGDTLPVRIT